MSTFIKIKTELKDLETRSKTEVSTLELAKKAIERSIEFHSDEKKNAANTMVSIDAFLKGNLVIKEENPPNLPTSKK